MLIVTLIRGVFMKPFIGNSILITGCSSGIGLCVARDMHDLGWNVVAACRKKKDSTFIQENYGIKSVVIDYEKEETIQSGMEIALKKLNGRLDVLFNNGAYAMPGAVEDIPVDSLRKIFEANFFGWHLLTKEAIPIMRKQGFGRIIQNSSVLGFAALRYRGAYNATKFALEGLTDTLRLELYDTGIKVILIEPGPIRTKIRENSYPHFKKSIKWKDSPNGSIYEKYLIPRLEQVDPPMDRFELMPSAVSKAVIHACTSKNPHNRYRVTLATKIIMILKRLLTSKAFDSIARKI
ncbi:MAG: NAD(P)-dependent dehydrogenase (short-subunit alcohol dehydrogenase family) [Alphaproteobacteria bacterium]|jgi:NAD(P)-dependent dehydrogenase (short-subunit alcohol dehydrogenase family)|tara:strand:+ start:817 stop:1695 length:879 start_codon:yes stop_codon:yes gene_type:complete